MSRAHSPTTPNPPLVVVIGTGGTIAATAPEPTRPYAYQDSQHGIAQLLKDIPRPHRLKLESEQPFQLGSEDFDEATWRALHAKVGYHLARPEVTGVVLAQGTDTIEETAYFLHLALGSAKPVVVTGAMRPAGTLSSDVAINLYQALALAAHPSAMRRGVLVVLNERIYSPDDVIKSHTYAADSFASPQGGPLGLMLGGEPRWLRQPSARRTLPLPSGTLTRPLPRVDLVWAYAGIQRDAISAAISAGACGLVYAGTGNGSIASALKPMLLQAALQGCVVVRASRTGAGIVVRNAAEDDDVLCSIASIGVPAVKARILLQLGLAAGVGSKQLQQMFEAYSFQN